jgi:Type IV pili methyl-accepting chemotaxis transducer N-term
MHRRQLIAAGLGSTLLLGSPLARSQVGNLGTAINRAGRQRALSQRLSKAYAQQGLGVNTLGAARVISDSVRAFDTILAELRAFAPNDSIRQHYAKLDGVWQQSKAIVSVGEPQIGRAPQLLVLDAQLLALAHEGTGMFQRLAERPSAELVNVAGRQRMLSQRIAKYYFCSRWGVATAEAKTEIDKARREFEAGLALLTARANHPSQRDALDLARNQWTFFILAFESSFRTDSPQTMSRVASASELILKAFDDVTQAFERSALTDA